MKESSGERTEEQKWMKQGQEEGEKYEKGAGSHGRSARVGRKYAEDSFEKKVPDLWSSDLLDTVNELMMESSLLIVTLPFKKT